MDNLKEDINRLFSNPSADSGFISIIKMQMVREHECLYGKEKLQGIEAAAALARQLFANADREIMAVMSVSGSMEPLAVEIVSVGGLDFCDVDMKNMFKHAILSNARGIICLHNHPSGCTAPSQSDWTATERIQKAGELLDIKMFDHIIVGNGSYYSFFEGKTFEF